MPRTGYCCRCGDCCTGNPYTGNGDEWCPELLPPNENGERLCRVWEADIRPCGLTRDGFDHWPDSPDIVALYPHCTFKFE